MENPIIVPFDLNTAKKINIGEILSVKAHLCSVFSGFVKIGDWYLKMSEVKEYKPVTAEDMNPYILFKTSKFGNIKVRFQKDEDMNAELLILDQLFDVE